MANEIFISYRRTDEPRARLFYNLLKDRGVEAWYDAKIQAGEDWRTTTANALNDAPIFVLLLSRTATESSDIAKELAAATHKRKLVVPVRLDNMPLEGMFLYELASRNWTDAYDNTEQRLAELADKLAALVNAGLSPDATAALDINTANITAANAAAMNTVAKPKRFDLSQRSGSVAVMAAAGLALVAAAGGGVWFLNGSSGSKAEAESASTESSAESSQPVAEQIATPFSLAGSLNEAVEAAKAIGRSETEIATLADAGAKISAMLETAETGGDPTALSQLAAEMNDIGLAAAREHIAVLASDPVIASVKSDIRVTLSELKASGAKADAAFTTLAEEADAAQATLKAASEAASGTDPVAAMASLKASQQSVATLMAMQPALTDAYIKAKRQSYASNSAVARSVAGQIAQLAAGAKKPNVFASGERKDAYKFLTDTDIWARERMAQVDVVAASVATAERRAVIKHASLAATSRTELEAALANAKTAAAKLGN